MRIVSTPAVRIRTARDVREQIPTLSSSNFDANFFRQALANFFRQAVMHAPGALFGGIEYGDRRRCGYSHTQPDQRR